VLLTIGAPLSGDDLGYLLHKNPARVHSFELPFGQAHVFYPQLSAERSEASLLLDVDPVALVRGEGGLDQYVNDRPYAASSFLSTAISRVFGTALGGRSKERPELAEEALPWDAVIAAVPCPGGEKMVRGLFEPLGYRVETTPHPLDDRFPEWGEGLYQTVRLSGRVRLCDLLTHIYVLIPALDGDKHYWAGRDELEKLLKKGEGWLAAHPLKETIATRYLRFSHKLTREALARLAGDDAADPEAASEEHLKEEQIIEAPLKLWEQRMAAVMAALRTAGAKSVVDLGCGEGKLLKHLIEDLKFERIVGMDVSARLLAMAVRRLKFDRMPAFVRQRISLIQGSLMYRDQRLAGFDAAAAIEVIEHLDPPRLAAFERVVFEHARPHTIVITTPNAEYNALFPTLPHGQFRHQDHRFEWGRSKFQEWAAGVARLHGYTVQFLPVGPEDSALGPPTQMGVFSR
jgi:3' terminal RNA ribose 2'-O-methyltransferase Hen1